ncbi:hypothetical protein [Methylocystis parvus]|uniref:hypothetical protein n=1 Tax=Methylocystis parvus TaxID=134 RepID=UPI003C79639B
MAVEASRTTSVRRIKNPDDSSVYVDLKVIDKITFYDGRNRGQETEYEFRNDPASGRVVSTHSIDGDGGQLDVEVIERLITYNGRDRGQATDWSFFSPGTFPPVHLEYEDIKVYADEGTNEDVWIKVRRVKVAKWYNGRDRGQEMELRLDWAGHDDYTGLTPLITEYDGTSINPPWRLDPFQQIIDVSWEAKYLAVFYSGNRIAAIPMSKLSTDPTPTYDEESNGSWGSDKLKTMQAKLQSGFCVAFCPLKVEDVDDGMGGTIATPSAETNHQFTVVSKTSALKSFAASSLDKAAQPIFNGASGTYYTAWDVFSADATSVSLSSTDFAPNNEPYAISHSGTYYYTLEAQDAIGIEGFLLNACDDSDISYYSGVVPAVSASVSSLKSSNAIFTFYTTKTTFGGGGSNFSRPGSGSTSADVPWLFYSRSGGLDSLAIEMKTLSISAAVFDDTPPLIPADTATGSFLGKSFTVTNPQEHYFGVLNFPFAKSESSRYLISGVGSAGFSAVDFITPYGTLSGVTVSGNPISGLKSWLQISNGSHDIQGFVVGSTAHAYLDGASWAPTGIALADIQTMIMDMPLSRIQELAPPPPP